MRYNRKVSDVFAVQEEIARQISGILRLQLTGEGQNRLVKRYTDNVEAYQLYLKGRFFWDKRTSEGMDKAREAFNQAIELDPNYAVAYAGLADTYFFFCNSEKFGLVDLGKHLLDALWSNCKIARPAPSLTIPVTIQAVKPTRRSKS